MVPGQGHSQCQETCVEFADAIGVFDDPGAITIEDSDSEGEGQRFLSIGLDFLGRLIVVAYTYRGDNIRVISARKATRKEISVYEKRIF